MSMLVLCSWSSVRPLLFHPRYFLLIAATATCKLDTTTVGPCAASHNARYVPIVAGATPRSRRIAATRLLNSRFCGKGMPCATRVDSNATTGRPCARASWTSSWMRSRLVDCLVVFFAVVLVLQLLVASRVRVVVGPGVRVQEERFIAFLPKMLVRPSCCTPRRAAKNLIVFFALALCCYCCWDICLHLLGSLLALMLC